MSATETRVPALDLEAAVEKSKPSLTKKMSKKIKASGRPRAGAGGAGAPG